ncbi:hypothetical protein SNE40_011890 [Patella caerulea]|uniref:Synaptonemal complex protein 2 n=1 Tax=Patella caerulea TaxID=87958 RepID=A0AAN8PUV4_PATCE
MDALSQELHPIRKSIIEISPVDLSSVDCVEKLQSVLSECQQILQNPGNQQEDEGVLSLLKYGLENLIIESLEAFVDQSDAVDESNENLLDVILETINVLCENSSKACEMIVPKMSIQLLEMLTYQVFSFQQKMEILKSLNIILEYSTFIVKEKLLTRPSFMDILKQLFNLILYVGDYEFQVGAIECFFRLIPRKVRNLICQQIITDPRHLATFLLIKDSNFETDCRTFLNNLNSSLGERKRVMSIPCISVQLGSRSLQKPSDQGYNEFWVDFNYGSKRITIFCEQDSLLQCSQTEEDDLWETVSILRTDINSYTFTESNHTVCGIFELTADVTEVFSQMRNIEGNKLIIVADQAYNLPSAVNKTLSQFEKSERKASAVCEPLDIKLSDSNLPKPRKPSNTDPEVVASSQMSVASSVIDGTQRRHKVSVPFLPMSTPARTSLKETLESNEKTPAESELKIQNVKTNITPAKVKPKSSSKDNCMLSPRSPIVNSNLSKKRVKTPVVVLEPDKKAKEKTTKTLYDFGHDANKENLPPKEYDDVIIPDSLPSQSVKCHEKKQNNRKLREVDSGICLIEPDQLDKSVRNKHVKQVPTTANKQSVSRSHLMSVAEATKLCMESDDNISDLSSEIACVEENESLEIIVEENVNKDSLEARNTKSVAQNPKSLLSKQNNFSPIMSNKSYNYKHCEQQEVRSHPKQSFSNESHKRNTQNVENSISDKYPDCLDSNRTKYGKGKSSANSKRNTDQSKNNNINQNSVMSNNSTKNNKSGATLSNLSDYLTKPIYGKEKSNSSFSMSPSRSVTEANVENNSTKYGKGKTYHLDKPLCVTPASVKQPLKYSLNVSKGGKTGPKSLTQVNKSKSENDINLVDADSNQNRRTTRLQSKVTKKDIDLNSEQKKSQEVKIKKAEKETKVQNIKQTESKAQNEKNNSKNKAETSKTVDQSSTRSLRRRKAEDNTSVQQEVSLFRSQGAENIHCESPKKVSRKENRQTHSTQMSSTKKSFFFETRTVVTNSYRSFVERNESKQNDEDPYNFDDAFSDSQNSLPINKSKSEKTNKKNDSCVMKKKNIDKTEREEQSLLQHQRNNAKPYTGFSDDEDDRTKQKFKNKTKTKSFNESMNMDISCIQSCKSLPNLTRSVNASATDLQVSRAPRSAKTNQTYYINSDSNSSLEENLPAKNKDVHKDTTSKQKQKTLLLDKTQNNRDSDQFTIFNRDSWGKKKSAEKTPRFDLNLSKSTLPTPVTCHVSKKDDNNKTGAVETFTAMCTGLILDSKQRDRMKLKSNESKPCSSKSCETLKNDDISSRKSIDGRSEVSWLEKKSSGKRKKFKKTYHKDRSIDKHNQPVNRHRNQKVESSEEQVETSEEEEEVSVSKLILNMKNTCKGKEMPKNGSAITPKIVHAITPKIRDSKFRDSSPTPKIKESETPMIRNTDARTPRSVIQAFRKEMSPQVTRTPLTPGLPSLCIVSEDAATAPNSIKLKKQRNKSQKKQYQESDGDDKIDKEDASQPISMIASQPTITSQSTSSEPHIEPTSTQILSLEELLKMATPKHIQEIIKDDGGDTGDEDDEEDDGYEEQQQDAGCISTDERNTSKAGCISGPSSRARPTKSTLKRKYPEVSYLLEEEEEEQNTSSETHNNSQTDLNCSSFIPRKLFKTNKCTPDRVPTNQKTVCETRNKKQKQINNYPISISTDGTDKSQELDVEDDDELSVKTGVTAVVRTFGVDIQNQLQAKRRQLESIAKSTLKSSQKMSSKIWSKQQTKRNKVLESYQQKMLQELTILEKEIDKLKNEEDKTMNFFSQQMKLLKTYRDSQEKRVRNLSRNQENLEEELNNVDNEGCEQQEHYKIVLKKDMTALQQRLLKETQQHQLNNMRKCLQTLFL